MTDIIQETASKLDDNECKGRFYRLRQSSYINSKGEYIYQERFSPLKRISCKGCEFCDFLDEYLHESCSIYIFPRVDKPIDNAVYKLQVVEEYKDLETGIVDDFDLGFCIVNEPKGEK